MVIRDLNDCKEFIAGDGSLLRQLLHPETTNTLCRYSVCHATVKPHQRTKAHRLQATEVYYILEGEGFMYIDDESQRVERGQLIYIPPRAKQHIENIGNTDLFFLCIVDPAWNQKDEEVLDEENEK